MGIGWLWHTTHSAEPDSLRVANEARAASAYARWRAVHRWLNALAHRFRDARRERIALGELERLSDFLLRDIGLRRDGDGSIVPERRPRPRPRVPIAPVLVLEDAERRRTSDVSPRAEDDREERRRCA